MSKLEEVAKNATLLLGIDRDGTIVPYAATPAEAIIAPNVKNLLIELSQCEGVILAIVSARSVFQLRGDVGDTEVILAGNYGLEIAFPSGKNYVHPEALNAVPELEKIKVRLEELAGKVPNSFLENQMYALHLHYRNVAKNYLSTIHKSVSAIARRLSNLKMRAQPTSYEFFPKVEWNKANALELIRKELNLCQGHFGPIFIGDTDADEPAFEWSNKLGGSSARVAPYKVNTQAKEVLANPEAAVALLKEILASRSSEVRLLK
jgi:trehalose-phosphatase